MSRNPKKPEAISDKTSARERLLDTAGALFHRYGFQAVGIDRILAESGVAKMTMYRYFASKDEMIAAYLERANTAFWNWADRATTKAPTPEAKLVALFEAIETLSSSPECLGCVFQGAALAFPEFEHPSHQIAAKHKTEVRDYLTALATQARLREPVSLAVQLALLIDGAWITARVFPGRSTAGVAAAARALIESRHRSEKHSRNKK